MSYPPRCVGIDGTALFLSMPQGVVYSNKQQYYATLNIPLIRDTFGRTTRSSCCECFSNQGILKKRVPLRILTTLGIVLR
jgi:hypothetical protein